MNLLSWLFPERCVGCNGWGEYMCPDCLNRLSRLYALYCPACRKISPDGVTHPSCRRRESLDGLISAYAYSGLMRQLVGKFKYRLVKDLTDALLELMVSGLDHPQLYRQWTLVPVPLHPRRQRWRGFNQAEVLGKKLADALSWDYANQILWRKRMTQPQMELTGDKRKQNLKAAFGVSKRPIPASIKLIETYYL